ncbi:MAG: HEAT repeat domain-containing protein [Chloroflexota bacterium]
MDDQAELQRLLAKLESDDIASAAQASIELMKLGEIAVEPLIGILRDSAKSRIWSFAISSLGDIGDTRAVEPLIDLLKNPLSHVWTPSRKYTAFALAKFKDDRAVDVLLEMLHDRLIDEEDDYDEPDYETILAAAEALASIGDLRALEPSINRIFEGDDYWQNGETLRTWGESALNMLLSMIESDDEQIRRGVAALLGEFGDKRAVEPLIERLKADSSPEVRSSAAYGLSELADPRAFDSLTEALHDPYEQTRAYAASGLGQLKDERAVTALMEATHDEHPLVRMFATSALEFIKASKKQS